MKLFTTFNEDVVRQCQYFTGYMPLEHTLFLKKFNFLNALKFSQNWMLVSLFELTAVQELTSIYEHYSLESHVELSYNSMQKVIYNHFESKINL